MRIPRTRPGELLPPAGPLRRIAGGTLVSAIGNGAWFTSWALFLTRSVGLSPAQVGIGMTLAAALGVLATPALGWLGDRAGARETFAAQLAIQGIAARTITAGTGEVRARVSCGAPEFLRSITQRATWHATGVTFTGDAASLAAAQQLKVF